jgi:hypothetical protein
MKYKVVGVINSVVGGLIDVSVCEARRLVIAQCRRGDYPTAHMLCMLTALVSNSRYN